MTLLFREPQPGDPCLACVHPRSVHDAKKKCCRGDLGSAVLDDEHCPCPKFVD